MYDQSFRDTGCFSAVVRAASVLAAGSLAFLAACALPHSSGHEARPTAAPVTNVLACRLANYGPFQERAWTHLHSIGIGYVFCGILQEHGYPGPITMEIEGIQGIERNRQEIEGDIVESAAYLRSLQPFK